MTRSAGNSQLTRVSELRALIACLFFLTLTLNGQDTKDIRHFDSLIQAGSYAEAAEQLTVYSAAHPNSWEAFYQLGYVDFRLHHLQASVTALCRSLVLNKDSSQSHKILAYDLNILGHQDMAIHELTEAIRCDASNAEAHYELGRIWFEQGLYLKAVQELEKAKSLAREFVRVYHNLGLAYSALGQNQKAIESFEEGLRLNSGQASPSAWPLIDYATYLNTQNQFSKARDLLVRAIQMNQSWDEAYSQLAKAYRGLNEPDQAVSSLRQAIALNTKNAEYHYVLARLYTQTHRLEEAKQELAAYERYKTREP